MTSEAQPGRKYRQHGEQKRTKRIFIRVSPAEYDAIKEQAGEQSMGGYLVGLALPPDPPSDPEGA